MAASYPASIKTFTTKVDNVDFPQAVHVNDMQDEINAIETGLINGFAHNIKFLTDNLYNIGASLANRPAAVYSASFIAERTGAALGWLRTHPASALLEIGT